MAKKILAIDDDENIRRFISLLLTENGYDADTACDGAEGLQMVTQAKPDLIVLDVMMPKKTGLTLFKQLKRDDQYKDVPILMLTGVTGVIEEMETHKDETFEHPFDNLREALKKSIRELRDEGLVKPEMFVDKPVDPDSFVERVRQLIGT
jgi:two-component system phosphate regulon response regulator PhoB